MVETSGLTRSKGSVSQAGKTSTRPEPPPGVKASRSWASCSAAAPVGVTTSTGRRVPSRSRPARTKAWAGVATARVALDAPTTRVMAGSLRSRAGSERRLTGSGYRGGAGGRRRRPPIGTVARRCRRGTAAARPTGVTVGPGPATPLLESYRRLADETALSGAGASVRWTASRPPGGAERRHGVLAGAPLTVRSGLHLGQRLGRKSVMGCVDQVGVDLQFEGPSRTLAGWAVTG